METENKLKNQNSLIASIIASVREHPYLCAALICIIVEVFTLGDQQYIAPQSVMTAALLSGLIAFAMLSRYLKKFRVPVALGCGFICLLWGIAFSLIEKKGGLMAAVVFVCTVGALAFMYLKKKFTYRNMTFLIVFAAFGMYISYIVYTWSVIRQTDVAYWWSDSGHAGYTKYLYDHWFALPDHDPRETWQFYHTPLFYYISAVLIRIVTLFGVEFETAAEVSQIVTLFSAMSIVITSYKLFGLFKLKGAAMTAAMAVLCLSNTMIMMSGSISNDITAAAFELGALYCAAKWYGSRSMRDIVCSALCMGLGLMTKLSAWMAAPSIALIFVTAFIGQLKNKQSVKKCFGQFAAFLGISVPLGMWFPVYNNIRWGVPFGYIPEGGENMFVGERSVWERLFTASRESLSTPFMLEQNYLFEYNPIVTLLKSSADLQRLASFKSLAPLLCITIILTAVIIAVSIVGMILSVLRPESDDTVKKNKKGGKKAGTASALAVPGAAVLLLWLVTMVSYIIFCIKYPFTCTENVRYVIPVITITALYFGRVAGRDHKNGVFGHIVRYFCLSAAAVYGSVFMFTFVLLGFD